MAKEYRKAKKTANAKSTTGRLTKTTTKPPRTALGSLRAHEILTPMRQGLRQMHQTEPLVGCKNRTNGTEGMIKDLLDAIKKDRRGVIEEPTLPEEEEAEMTLVGATGLTVRMTTTTTGRCSQLLYLFGHHPERKRPIRRLNDIWSRWTKETCEEPR